LIAVIVVPLVLVGLWLGFGLLAQRMMVFPGRFIPVAEVDPAAFDQSVETWTVGADGEADAGVEAWYFPRYNEAGDGVDRTDEPGPALIFAHGNGELIDHWLGLLDPYRRMGLAVLLVEYRGYGRSPGDPSQRSITDDFAAAYDRLAARPEVDAERIVFHGRSIGGGVACSLARERNAAALILQSTFTSVADMAGRFGFPGALMRDRFDNAAFLDDYGGPVLLMHGRQDTLIPVSHSLRLHDLAHRSELFLVDSNHNDFPIDAPQVWAIIEQFLREHRIVE